MVDLLSFLNFNICFFYHREGKTSYPLNDRDKELPSSDMDVNNQ